MALQGPGVSQNCRTLVIGDETAMTRALEILGVPDPLTRVKAIRCESVQGPGPYFFASSRLSRNDIAFARPTLAAATATIAYIRQAVDAARDGLVDAVCTAPINKSVLKQAGFAFPGHTEFLQQLTGAGSTVMMLVGSSLRVSLVTIHCALADVPRRLTVDLVADTIMVTHQALIRDLGISRPRVAVAGLNPHAGEGGLFGDEEQRIIEPAVDRCKQCGVDVQGPFPPDTVFCQAHTGGYDAVVSMYHDQGLIPLKLLHFQDAVNVTLGLPIIRTSVDHGTAYDLAGTGKASPASLIRALSLAAAMARQRSSRRAQRAEGGA